jgi:hypothetical protein
MQCAGGLAGFMHASCTNGNIYTQKTAENETAILEKTWLRAAVAYPNTYQVLKQNI